MNQNNPPNENSSLLVLRIIWAMILASQFFYLVGVIISSKDAAVTHMYYDPASPLSFPMAMISFFSLVIAVLLPNYLFKLSAKENINTAEEQTMQKLLPKFFTPFIIRLALFEAIALYGFVLGFLSHDYYRMVPFLFVSVTGFLLNFPTADKVRTSLLSPTV